MNLPITSNDRPYEPEAYPLKKEIKFGFMIGVIIMIFINMIIAIIAHSSMSAYSGAIMDFRANWELAPFGKYS